MFFIVLDVMRFATLYQNVYKSIDNHLTTEYLGDYMLATYLVFEPLWLQCHIQGW